MYSIEADAKIVNNYMINLDDAKLTVESLSTSSKKLILVYKSNDSKNKLTYILNDSIYTIFKKVGNNQIPSSNLISDTTEEIKLFICLALFNEISSSNADIITKQINSERVACSRTIISLQSTRSSATSNVTTTTDAFIKAHPDCKKEYGVDAGCVWEDYLCMATQSIICNGTGCDVPYGGL